MRNFWLTFLFVLLLGTVSLLGLPWWCLMPVGIVAGVLFPQSAKRDFFAGFAGGFLLWFLLALRLDLANEGLLAGRVGLLFGGIGRVGMLLVTGFIGGLVAGAGVLVGNYARFLQKTTAS